jgi:hypothetical protein
VEMMVRKTDVNIHRKMKKILDKKVDILLETGRIDPSNNISLSRLKHRYNELDKEYNRLKWQLSRRYEN